MSRGHAKLTDDDIRAILLAPAEVTGKSLAARFGVCPHAALQIRRREDRRALRIANELGLLPPPPLRAYWTTEQAKEFL